jgi:hypothetical protein
MKRAVHPKREPAAPKTNASLARPQPALQQFTASYLQLYSLLQDSFPLKENTDINYEGKLTLLGKLVEAPICPTAAQ